MLQSVGSQRARHDWTVNKSRSNNGKEELSTSLTLHGKKDTTWCVCVHVCVCVCVCILMWSPINFDITDNKINIISLFSKFTVLFDVVIHLNNYLVRFCSLIGTKPIRNNPYDHYSLEESWYILSRSLGTKISQLYLSPLSIRSKE